MNNTEVECVWDGMKETIMPQPWICAVLYSFSRIFPVIIRIVDTEYFP